MFKINKLKELKELTINLESVIKLFESKRILINNNKEEIDKIIKNYKKILKLNNKIILNNLIKKNNKITIKKT